MNSASSRTFHPFPNLPTELRRKIWKAYHAVIPPQFIYLYLSNPNYQQQGCEFWPHIFYYPQPIPILLHINREAREFGLEVFNAGFDVAQRRDTTGSWWRVPPNTGSDVAEKTYIPCDHESEVWKKRSGTETFLYWDPNKDVVKLGAEPRPLATKAKAWIWSGMCDIRFQNKTRWLAMDDNMMNMWTAAGPNFSNTVWQGMEVVFVIVSEQEPGLYWTGELQRRQQIQRDIDEREKIWIKVVKDVWVGKREGVPPEVQIVYASGFDVISAIIGARIGSTGYYDIHGSKLVFEGS